LLSETEFINHEYLWDYLQRPNILFDTGCNIVIFNLNTLLCPYKEFVNTFYDMDKPTVLITLTRHYYEPIYYIYQEQDNIHQKWIFQTNK